MLPHFYVNVPALRAGTGGGYALAFVSVGVAAVLRYAVDPYVVGVPLVTFWPAVIITALISGVGAGLFCVVLSAAAADFFVIQPHLVFYIENRGDLLDLLLFLVLGWFSVITITQLHDAIDRERAERALRESKQHLQLCLNAAWLGSWQYDPTRRVFSWDRRSKEILGRYENEATVEEFMTWVHPDDAGKVWAAYDAVLDPSEPERSATEFRIRRADDEVRWVRTWGLAHFDLVGASRERRVASVVGTVDDITEHKQHEELMRRQADLLDQSHDAILTLQTGGRGIVYWSRGAERLYGYTAAEAEGRITHQLLQTRAPIPIEDLDAQVVRRGSWNGELTHTARDGRDIVVESRIVRVSYNGDAFALETNRDITERKRHEEREHLIMREMNHRAKNMLGLVQAIARQTAARNPGDFVERFSERIQALSANQELLIRGERKGVETEDLVRAQLAPFADLIGTRITTQGPKLRLKAAGAQAIGLALHELATNAGKYGALSTDTGRVDICWATDGDIFTMSWVERDGPPVSAPKRRGFGTVVMQEMAEDSVDGTVDLDYAPSGLTWRLTGRAENTLEPQERSSSTLWDRTAMLESFSMACRHVAMGERHIARQREILAELERGGHNSLDSKSLLACFEELQNMHIAHRDRLEKTLAEISK
jgi:PAS domain S-box-containing protein